MSLALIVDDYDLSNIGVTVLAADPRRGGAPMRYAVEQVADRPEGVLLNSEPQYESYTVDIEILLQGTSIANYYTRLYELQARLRGQVTGVERGVVELEWDDQTSKVFRARLLSMTPTRMNDVLLTADRHVLSFLLLDPFRRDESTSSVNGITTATAIPLGSAPCWPVIRLNGDAGGVGAVTILYKTSTGTTRKTLSFTFAPTLGAADWVDIDMEAATIIDDASANRRDERTLGTDFPWMLDPRDGVYVSSSWPTLETSDGDLDVTYTKRYG